MAISLDTLRDFAAELATVAGQHTVRHFQQAITIDTKPDDSPVTIADREAERVMRAMISARFPDHGILGEEDGETRPGAPYRWILDPIDGTKSFIHGVPLYSVLVGLEREGELIAGAIGIPALGELVCAAKGQGALWNGAPCRVAPIDRLNQALFLCNDIGAFRARGRQDAYDRLAAATLRQRGWGDGYGYLLVATGRAQIMVDPVMNIWDCAGPRIIVEEAGGRFTDWQGRPTHDGGEAVATNGLLHDEVIAILRAPA